MASLRLILCLDPRRLLEHAAAGFLAPSPSSRDVPFPSPPYLLVLRQGGLRDDLLTLAAQRGVPGWFDPPVAVFHELPQWLGATNRAPVGDYERVVLLASVLRRAGARVFAGIPRLSDYVDAVDQHFAEPVGEGVPPEAYRAALESVQGRDEFERGRDADLAASYELYLSELIRENRRDGRDDRLDCALALAQDPDALSARLGGRREIRIVGLADLRGGWRPLLAALVASPALDQVTIYTGEAIDLGPGLNPVVERLEGEHPLAGCLARGEPSTGVEFDLIDSPDAEREVEEVARRIRRLADAGAPLDRIAVVARAARPWGDLVTAALEQLGVPVATRRRVAYAEIPVVRAILRLFAAAAEQWTRHSLTELAEQPYFTSQLDPRLIRFLGYRTRLTGLAHWERAFEQLMAETDPAREVGDEGDDHKKSLPSHTRAERGLAGFRRFVELAHGLEGQRPLAEWLGWLEHFLEADPWRIARTIYDLKPARPADHARTRIARLDLAGWNGVNTIVGDWRRAVERWGGTEEMLTPDQFHARLQEMLAGDATFWTETPRGVRVLEALAAAYRSFEHLFLVGLSSGQFPRRAPVSPIFAEEERQALADAGLPLGLREAWDRRERSLFRALVSGAAGKLTVSASRMDEAGRETASSVFLEELAAVAKAVTEEIPSPRVLTPGRPVLRDWSVAAHAARIVEVEGERARGVVGPWNGLITDPALIAWLGEHHGDEYTWSPTQLESYAKCPWAWFSGRLLRLEKLEDPDDDMDPATRGTIMHEALQRFYDRARKHVGRPVFLRAGDLAWARPMLETALAETLKAAEGRLWLGHAALRVHHLRELGRVLTKYLDWEVEQHEEMYDSAKRNAPRMVRTAVDRHEVGIDGLVFERGGVRIKIRGRIDRVEVGCDERVDASNLVTAVDYKSSIYSTPGSGNAKAWDDGIVLQVPLYAWALTQLNPGSEVCRVEYRAIKQRKLGHPLELYQVTKGGKLAPDEKANTKMEAALDAVAAHVTAVRQGYFPARPAESSSCPPWCHGWEICRVPGGPRGMM